MNKTELLRVHFQLQTRRNGHVPLRNGNCLDPFWKLPIQGEKCEFANVNDHFFNTEMVSFRKGPERLLVMW